MSTRTRGSGLVTRPARAIPTGLLAVGLLVLGGVGIWLLGTFLVEDAWPAAASGAVDSVAAAGVDSLGMRIAAIALAVVGLALLLCAVVPGRPSRVRILGDDVPGETALARRDLARRIQRRAENVDGVHSARVTVRRGRVDVLVHTVVDDPASVTRGATAAVDRALAELRPIAPTRSRVRVHRRS